MVDIQKRQQTHSILTAEIVFPLCCIVLQEVFGGCGKNIHEKQSLLSIKPRLD